MATDGKTGGILGAFDRAHGKIVRFCTARGYLFTLVILPTVAVAAANPTLGGITASFFNFAATNFTQNFVPGWEVLGSAASNAAGQVASFALS